MALISASAVDLDGGNGKAPDDASLDVGLLRYDATTVDVITTRSFPVQLEHGYAEFDVPPSQPGNAYRIRPRGFNAARQWFVAVPNVAAISLAELIRDHQVDPTTLTPGYEDQPGWAVEAIELRRLIELGGATDAQLAAAVGPLIAAHVNDESPHPAYDNIPDLTLLVENELI